MRHTLNVDSFIWVFFQLQPLLYVFSKEITNLLIVDFQIGCMDQILGSFRNLYFLKDMVKGSATIRNRPQFKSN